MTDPGPQALAPIDPLPEAAHAAIAEVVARHKAAGGLLMKIVNAAGGQIENQLEMLPDSIKGRIETAAVQALEAAYRLAGRTAGGRADLGDRGHLALATFSGAVGGLGGLPSALAELPVTTTVIFRAIQSIAAGHGFDPSEPSIQAECLKVFGSGSPLADDDGINTSFLGAKVTLTGPAMQRMIAMIAPRFAAVLGQKLAAQAVPLIGAVTGAGVNYAFTNYYQEMAHVRFALMRLSNAYGADAVTAAFRAAATPAKITKL